MAMSSVVQTKQGTVRGAQIEGIHVFKGMAYAATPFGPNRLLPPKPVEPWTGVRDALAFGPKSPQLPYPPPVDVLVPELTVSGEDCLTLNVWSPELGSANRPVMVWIPGGMFEYHATGASPWYDGSRFARDGIVCVTINYRVAADGFLYLGEDNANRGLLDQIAALEWVQDNIASFGGDPGNVTVFGESAGAISIGALLSMPRTRGLFRRAIAQSGAAHHAISVGTAQRVAQRLCEQLGVELSREAIAAIPTERLLQAQAALRGELVLHPDPERWGPEVVTAMLPWQPVIDGRLLPERPIDRITAGAASNIDLLIGTNVEEHRLFLVSSGAIDQIRHETVVGALAGYGLPVDEMLAAYQAAHPEASAGDLLAALQTDWYWRIPAIRLADAHANRASKTYMYEFAWRSPQFNGRLGACHALEIAFVFDTLGHATEPLMGSEPPQELADAMHAAWVAFAATGDCGWPSYDLDRRATMRFDTISHVVDDPRSAERALWEGLR